MGIGGATARRLAEDGVRVLVADIEESAAAGKRSHDPRSRRHGGILLVDVGTRDGVRGMVERAVELWGRLDIVVNNAYAGRSARRCRRSCRRTTGTEPWTLASRRCSAPPSTPCPSCVKPVADRWSICHRCTDSGGSGLAGIRDAQNRRHRADAADGGPVRAATEYASTRSARATS